MILQRTDNAEAGVRAQAPDELRTRYRIVRAETERLCTPLSAEDQGVQSMPDASPAKWHRAHTTWFFEAFVLRQHSRGYRVFNPDYNYLFNSYYDAVGERHARERRGLLTRPSADEIACYRGHVDRAMEAFLETVGGRESAATVELGLQHEQQHQELLLTDILHALAQNPLLPAYAISHPTGNTPVRDLEFLSFDGGCVPIGHTGNGFAFDNEAPCHTVILSPYRLANRLVTNSEWLAFMEDGGYSTASLWMADGWQRSQAEGWQAPLYWQCRDGEWLAFGLCGLNHVEPEAPVCHVSYYEADAFARWSGCRLPTEAEWEHAARREDSRLGNFRDSGKLHPVPVERGECFQLFGDVWEWTQSPYSAYPGYRPPVGAIGEYNGKFMINQMVLRGGSCVSSRDHLRASYRNFFYPHQRWQFSGVRLARDAAQSRKAPRNPFLEDVWNGLARSPKTLPSKYFYDAAGSAIYEQICDLPEYYPTRTETRLLQDVAPELGARMAGRTALVEFGCGASRKTRILFDELPSLSLYVPVDICEESLGESARRIARDYPGIRVSPVAGDFLGTLPPVPDLRDSAVLGFFPGSTIGNLDDSEAEVFLRRARSWLGDGAEFLVGIDLVKNTDVLLRAYDDAGRVTAAFNRNLLVRINRELGAGFDADAFAHRAVWNGEQSRIEMHLVSKHRQSVVIRGRCFDFDAGETIHTENSRKYRLGEFAAIADRAGWAIERSWNSSDPAFALVLLR